MIMLIRALPHAAAVHMPIALAVLFPVFYGVAWWCTSKDLLPVRIWYGLWALAAVQVVSIIYAIYTGERAEFLSAGNHQLIEQHEHMAENFRAVAIAVFLGLSLALALTGIKRTVLHSILMLLLIGQLILAFYVGHMGGEL